MKLALYMRLSIEEFGERLESESISSQRLILKEFIVKDSALKVMAQEEYIDDGFSGMNFNRPSLQRLLEDVKNGKISCIVVKDLSRFSRDYISVGDYLENIFPFLNVRFISINDGYDSAKEQGNGTDIDIQFKSLLYDFYSKDISDKVKTSMTEMKKQGKFLAWSPPFGYMKDPEIKHKIIVDIETAPIVRRVFELALNGMATRKIAVLLNEEKTITPSERKKELTNHRYLANRLEYKGNRVAWTSGTVIDILMNENYTGTYTFNMQSKSIVGGRDFHFKPKDEWDRVYDNHEAIISKEDFDEVRRILSAKQFIGKNTDYEWYKKSPLQKYVRCSHCGHILMCEVTKKKNAIGEVIREHKYFRCRICPQRGNEKNSNRGFELEEKIYNFIKEKYGDLKQDETKRKDETKSILKKIQTLESEKIKAYENYKADKLTRERFLEFKKKTEEKLTVLQEKLEQQSKVQQDEKLDDVLTREMVEKYIDAIYVYQNEIKEIKWK